jgi:hypothetical protein
MGGMMVLDSCIETTEEPWPVYKNPFPPRRRHLRSLAKKRGTWPWRNGIQPAGNKSLEPARNCQLGDDERARLPFRHRGIYPWLALAAQLGSIQSTREDSFHASGMLPLDGR